MFESSIFTYLYLHSRVVLILDTVSETTFCWDQLSYTGNTSGHDTSSLCTAFWLFCNIKGIGLSHFAPPPPWKRYVTFEHPLIQRRSGIIQSRVTKKCFALLASLPFSILGDPLPFIYSLKRWFLQIRRGWSFWVLSQQFLCLVCGYSLL